MAAAADSAAAVLEASRQQELRKEIFSKAKTDEKGVEDKVLNPKVTLDRLMDRYTAQEILQMNFEDSALGMAPLLVLASAGHLEGVKKLLEAGADINETRSTDGYTALHLAAKESHVEVCQALITSGADITMNTKEGYNAFMLAVATGKAEVVNLMGKLHQNFDINHTNQKGNTALHLAADRGWAGCVRMLLNVKAERDIRNEDGLTPLMIASKRGDKQTVHLLVENKADIFSVDKNCCTAICLAISQNKQEVANHLLDRLDTDMRAAYVKRRISVMHMLPYNEKSLETLGLVVYHTLCFLAGKKVWRDLLYSERCMECWLIRLKCHLENEPASLAATQGICYLITCNDSTEVDVRFLEQFIKYGGPDIMLTILQHYKGSQHAECLVGMAMLALLTLSKSKKGLAWLETCDAISTFTEMLRLVKDKLPGKAGDMANKLPRQFWDIFEAICQAKVDRNCAELLAREEREKAKRERRREKKRQKRQLQKAKDAQMAAQRLNTAHKLDKVADSNDFDDKLGYNRGLDSEEEEAVQTKHTPLYTEHGQRTPYHGFKNEDPEKTILKPEYMLNKRKTPTLTHCKEGTEQLNKQQEDKSSHVNLLKNKDEHSHEATSKPDNNLDNLNNHSGITLSGDDCKTLTKEADKDMEEEDCGRPATPDVWDEDISATAKTEASGPESEATGNHSYDEMCCRNPPEAMSHIQSELSVNQNNNTGNASNENTSLDDQNDNDAQANNQGSAGCLDNQSAFSSMYNWPWLANLSFMQVMRRGCPTPKTLVTKEPEVYNRRWADLLKPGCETFSTRIATCGEQVRTEPTSHAPSSTTSNNPGGGLSGNKNASECIMGSQKYALEDNSKKNEGSSSESASDEWCDSASNWKELSFDRRELDCSPNEVWSTPPEGTYETPVHCPVAINYDTPGNDMRICIAELSPRTDSSAESCTASRTSTPRFLNESMFSFIYRSGSWEESTNSAALDYAMMNISPTQSLIKPPPGFEIKPPPGFETKSHSGLEEQQSNFLKATMDQAISAVEMPKTVGDEEKDIDISFGFFSNPMATSSPIKDAEASSKTSSPCTLDISPVTSHKHLERSSPCCNENQSTTDNVSLPVTVSVQLTDNSPGVLSPVTVPGAENPPTVSSPLSASGIDKSPDVSVPVTVIVVDKFSDVSFSAAKPAGIDKCPYVSLPVEVPGTDKPPDASFPVEVPATDKFPDTSIPVAVQVVDKPQNPPLPITLPGDISPDVSFSVTLPGVDKTPNVSIPARVPRVDKSPDSSIHITVPEEVDNSPDGQPLREYGPYADVNSELLDLRFFKPNLDSSPEFIRFSNDSESEFEEQISSVEQQNDWVSNGDALTELVDLQHKLMEYYNFKSNYPDNLLSGGFGDSAFNDPTELLLLAADKSFTYSKFWHSPLFQFQVPEDTSTSEVDIDESLAAFWLPSFLCPDIKPTTPPRLRKPILAHRKTRTRTRSNTATKKEQKDVKWNDDVTFSEPDSDGNPRVKPLAEVITFCAEDPPKKMDKCIETKTTCDPKKCNETPGKTSQGQTKEKIIEETATQLESEKVGGKLQGQLQCKPKESYDIQQTTTITEPELDLTKLKQSTAKSEITEPDLDGDVLKHFLATKVRQTSRKAPNCGGDDDDNNLQGAKTCKQPEIGLNKERPELMAGYKLSGNPISCDSEKSPKMQTNAPDTPTTIFKLMPRPITNSTLDVPVVVLGRGNKILDETKPESQHTVQQKSKEDQKDMMLLSKAAPKQAVEDVQTPSPNKPTETSNNIQVSAIQTLIPNNHQPLYRPQHRPSPQGSGNLIHLIPVKSNQTTHRQVPVNHKLKVDDTGHISPIQCSRPEMIDPAVISIQHGTSYLKPTIGDLPRNKIQNSASLGNITYIPGDVPRDSWRNGALVTNIGAMKPTWRHVYTEDPGHLSPAEVPAKPGEQVVAQQLPDQHTEQHILQHPELENKVPILWVPKTCTWSAMLNRLANLPIQWTEPGLGPLLMARNSKSFDIAQGPCGGIITLGFLRDGSEVAVKQVPQRRYDVIQRTLFHLQNVNLEHENLLPYKFWMSRGTYGLVVTELCECNLCVFMLHHRDMMRHDVKSRLILAAQILRGLAFLHSRNIAHCNLKPTNVLVDAHHRLRLADFGVTPDPNAHVFFPEYKFWQDNELHIGEGGDKPDQAHFKSDIKVAGMLLYYLLTCGEHPYGRTAFDIQVNKSSGRLAIRSIFDEADDLISAMMKVPAQNRPTTDECLRHPMFWDDDRKLQFLSTVAQDVLTNDQGREKQYWNFRTQLNNSSSIPAWIQWISSVLVQEVGLLTGYAYTNSLTDLLAFISHTVISLPVLSEVSRRLLGENISAYFISRFPRLLMFVYATLREALPPDLRSPTLSSFF